MFKYFISILFCFHVIIDFAQSQTIASFPNNFLFGIANAPGHVEDRLDDIWMDFGRSGQIRAFQNQVLPEERLRFWTQPEVEVDLATELGVQIFRLGVDWGRIHLGPGIYDFSAIERYREILTLIKNKNIKIMLTLFHFSLPKWIQLDGGWTNKKTKDHFLDFSKLIIDEFYPLVDYWITFNEPQIFATMAYSFGVFPSGKYEGKNGIFSTFNLGPLKGRTIKALLQMVESHKSIFKWSHEKYHAIQIGISQHMGYHTGKSLSNRLISKMTGKFMNWFFPERIKKHMDFFGFNYYGAEWIKGASISIDDNEEYSEAGRAINPKGLYHLSKKIVEKFPGVPLFLTENGIADDTDILRPSYLIEHLRVISTLLQENIPFLGYIHWTLTDNLEWADGYCPKFGLVSVDRANNLERIKRPSFNLFQKIIYQQSINLQQQEEAWNLIQMNVGKPRPFCRANDGRSALDLPTSRTIKSKDWRFYE